MALVGSENMIFHNLLHAEDGLSGCLTIILDYCHPSHFTSNPHIVLLILFSTAQVFQCSHFSLFSLGIGSSPLVWNRSLETLSGKWKLLLFVWKIAVATTITRRQETWRVYE